MKLVADGVGSISDAVSNISDSVSSIAEGVGNLFPSSLIVKEQRLASSKALNELHSLFLK